jgi:FdrA protein
MLTRYVVRQQSYQDSVKLMAISAKLRAVPGMELVAAVMGTESNRVTLQLGGFDLDDSVKAGPEDIIVALRGRDEAALEEAVGLFDQLIKPAGSVPGNALAPQKPRSLRSGMKQLEGANLALISIPGPYVAGEAHRALNAGLNVMIFSDNVSMEDEIALKKAGEQRGLLVMGPDCGTAIVNNTPLCFANAVQSGPIGIVGASGTGIQQATVIIDRLGSGISHAIGTGGRDLSDAVGGITALMGIDALEHDEATKVILIISKPPGPLAAERVLNRLQACRKPVVVAFMGADVKELTAAGVLGAANLEEAAAKAVALSEDRDPSAIRLAFSREGLIELAKAEHSKLGSQQRYVRGLFSGGTLADEAARCLLPVLGSINSNMGGKSYLPMKDVHLSEAHCIIDLGDDDFTKGRPHPMIDPSYRAERLLQEYRDTTVGVILCDVVLGYGSHPDPATALADAVISAREQAEHHVVVVASVCGTENDPQILSRQEDILRRAGIVVLPSNVYAAEFAGVLALALGERGGLSG